MITYDQFKIVADVLFFGGLMVAITGLLAMRKEVTAFGTLCAVSGFLTWFWNGLGWYANN